MIKQSRLIRQSALLALAVLPTLLSLSPDLGRETVLWAALAKLFR